MKKESKNRRIGTFAVTSVLALCLALGGLLSLSACGGPSGKELKLEAEKAILEGTPQGGDFVVESEDEEGTSGWEYVGNLANAGNSVTWVFESEEATSFDITFKLANPLTGEMDLSSCIGVSVNGEDKTVSAKLAAKGAEGWTDVKVRADNIQEGYNFVKLTVKQNSAGAGGTVAAPNVDCIVMYSDAITAHSHKWTTTQTGGCVEEGVTHTTCSSCKYSYDVAGAPANGHTVGEDGKCEVCGELVYVYEAEYADMSGITSSYGATIDASSTASNGHSVGSFSVEGNTLVFNIDSTKAEDVTFVFRLASTKWAAGSSGGNAHIADTVLREAVRIELNDTDITPDATLPGNSSEYYFNWSTAVATAAMREGANVLKIVSITSEGAPNIDCVQMTTGDAVLTWENIDNIGDAGTSNESGEVFTEKPANSYANEYLLEAEEADFTAGAVKEDCLYAFSDAELSTVSVG